MEEKKQNYGTIQHFKTLYQIATKEGVGKALEFDWFITQLRNPNLASVVEALEDKRIEAPKYREEFQLNSTTGERGVVRTYFAK